MSGGGIWVLLASVVAAVGTVLSAYIAATVRATQKTVNGRTSELIARVALLEELLRFSRADVETLKRERDEDRPGWV